MYSPNRQSTVTPNYGNSVAARAAAPGQQAKLARNLMGMPKHADGAVIDPIRNRLRQSNSEMLEASRQAQQGMGEAYDTGTLARYLSDSPAQKQSAVQEAAERAMQRQRMENLMGKLKAALPAHADGAVVAPESSPWEKLWKIITGKSTQEALNKSASSGGPQPMTPPQDDISVVRRAAEEAGKRNEEASNKKQPNIPKYCNGGVVR